MSCWHRGKVWHIGGEGHPGERLCTRRGSSKKPCGSQDTTEGRRLLPDLQSGPGGLAAGRINAEPGGWEGSEFVGSGRRRR